MSKLLGFRQKRTLFENGSKNRQNGAYVAFFMNLCPLKM